MTEMEKLQLLYKGIFIRSDFTIQSVRSRVLKRKVEALINKYDEEAYFNPSFQPENRINEHGDALLGIIKTRQDIASLIPVYCKETWFQKLLIALTLKHISYPRGRSQPIWAESFDVIGAYYFLSSIGFQSGNIYQFIAVNLKVPGNETKASTSSSTAAETVRKYIFNNIDKSWDPVIYPEHTVQFYVKNSKHKEDK
tara:strand:- start:3662 stop:4252 length:591 start_codon:yes stop_codon:yes gene_type:complete